MDPLNSIVGAFFCTSGTITRGCVCLKTHFHTIQVVRVQVLQWYRYHSFRGVPVDVGETLPSLQITVGPGFVLVIVVAVAAVLLRWLLVLLLRDALLKGHQRFPSKLPEAIRSWRCNKGCSHVFILQLLGL